MNHFWSIWSNREAIDQTSPELLVMRSFGLLYRQNHTVREGTCGLAWPLATLKAEENKSTRHTENAACAGLRKRYSTSGTSEENEQCGKGVAFPVLVLASGRPRGKGQPGRIEAAPPASKRFNRKLLN